MDAEHTQQHIDCPACENLRIEALMQFHLVRLECLILLKLLLRKKS